MDKLTKKFIIVLICWLSVFFLIPIILFRVIGLPFIPNLVIIWSALGLITAFVIVIYFERRRKKAEKEREAEKKKQALLSINALKEHLKNNNSTTQSNKENKPKTCKCCGAINKADAQCCEYCSRPI